MQLVCFFSPTQFSTFYFGLFPWSDKICLTWPYFGIYLSKITLSTSSIVSLTTAYRLTCLVIASVHTTRLFIPQDARGSGTRKSIHKNSFYCALRCFSFRLTYAWSSKTCLSKWSLHAASSSTYMLLHELDSRDMTTKSGPWWYGPESSSIGYLLACTKY